MDLIGIDVPSPFPDLEDLDLEFGQKLCTVCVELDNSDHLFRYLSEIQQEAKGGYIKGRLVVENVDYLGNDDSLFLDLSLASDQDSCEVSPNLLLFTHWKRKKRGLQVNEIMPTIEPFVFK